VYLAYDPPINGFEPGILFAQIENIQSNSTVVLNISIDENGLIMLTNCEGQSQGRNFQLEPKIYQHVNLAN
jgi:hypothetical protein